MSVIIHGSMLLARPSSSKSTMLLAWPTGPLFPTSSTIVQERRDRQYRAPQTAIRVADITSAEVPLSRTPRTEG